MPQRTAYPTMQPPGSPGASDLITHLLHDHGLGFYSDPPVRAFGPGEYDLTAMEADHFEQHSRGTPDHDHDWAQDRGGR